jgi:hypothetical protein
MGWTAGIIAFVVMAGVLTADLWVAQLPAFADEHGLHLIVD